MSKESPVCPLCGSTDIKPFISTKYEEEHGATTYFCNGCREMVDANDV